MTAVDPVGRKRIAVIEDDDDARQMLGELLSLEGYEVRAFHDAADALRVLRVGPAPDLILLDLRMPGMDGWQFRVEQKRDRLLAPVPVIALSADGSSQARAIDVDAFLEKPPAVPALLECIRLVLERRDEERNRTRQLVLGRMASLGTVAAGMAHEINNPLAYVLANLHLVREELDRFGGGVEGAVERKALVSQIDGLLGEALEGAGRIENIVRDMQTVWKDDNEPLAPMCINTVLETTVEVAGGLSSSRIRVLRALGTVPDVLGNKARFGQAILNLLVNAVQAIAEDAENGQVTITTRTGPLGEALISISDNGSGIRPEIRASIFEPFFTTRSRSSTGLGLSVCHGIVASMGGSIAVESVVGTGTTISLSFPPAAQPESDRDIASAAPLFGLDALRVLVVDDEPAIGRVLALILGADHKVTVTDGGEMGVACALAEEFDIVLCDLRMNDLSGADLFEKLRRDRSGLERRIVFMTGGAFTASDRAFIAKVANVVIEKPIDRSELNRAMRETLDRVKVTPQPLF